MGGGGGGSEGNADLQGGLKQIVRLSDDSYKLIYGKARVGGVLAFVESSNVGNGSDGVSVTGDNLFLHMIVVHAGHECDSITQIYLNDALVTLDSNGFVVESPFTTGGKSYVRMKHHFGSDTQIANSFLTAEVSKWTANHRLRGLTYTYIRYQWNQDVFASGIPSFNVVLKGKKVYDPRTNLTVWSDNAALCIRDYLTSRDSASVPYGFGAVLAEIDDTFTTASANICDENITKIDATTVKRFTINGAVDTAESPLANLEAMISAMAGAVTYPKGIFRIHAGAYDTPETEVVNEDWLSSGISAQLRIPRQDLFNAIRGVYIEPNNGWTKNDFPPITSSTYETEDNGERIYADIELPYTTDAEAAQRIAKIIQRKGREQISISMPCNYRALQFTVWDTIKVTNAAHGWSEKVFRIMGFSFSIQGGVSMDLREENSLSYSWAASDAEAVAAAPDTNLPNGFIVTVPSSVSYTSRSITTVGGDTVYNLVLQWALASNAFVSGGGSYEIQFKLSADAAWRPSFFVAGDFITADILIITINVAYDLRIRAINMLGAKSNYVTITGAMIGSSGGAVTTVDRGSVADAVTSTVERDSVANAVTSTVERGSVA